MAKHRHKREKSPRAFLPKSLPAGVVAAPVAALATAAVVGIGVFSGQVPVPADALIAAAAPASGAPEVTVSELLEREPAVTRGQSRAAAKAEKIVKVVTQDVRRTERAVESADTKLWASENLDVWSTAEDQSGPLDEIDAGDEVLVTGRQERGRAEVVLNGDSVWVNADYLTSDEPIPGLGGSCTNGTSVDAGVSSNIVAVHNAVCAAFPQITSYGELRGGGGDHPQGRAIDIMVSGELGWQIADFVRANASALGVSYVIYAQHIWSVERGGEGWRGMSNRGSATANHFDHVHVSTF